MEELQFFPWFFLQFLKQQNDPLFYVPIIGRELITELWTDKQLWWWEAGSNDSEDKFESTLLLTCTWQQNEWVNEKTSKQASKQTSKQTEQTNKWTNKQTERMNEQNEQLKQTHVVPTSPHTVAPLGPLNGLVSFLGSGWCSWRRWFGDSNGEWWMW